MPEHEHVIIHIHEDDATTHHEKHDHDGGELPHVHHPDDAEEIGLEEVT